MVDQGTMSNLIKTFHLAVTYLRIYPPSSQMVVATFDTFFKIVNALLEKNKTLTFSELSNKLLIDGEEPDNRETQLISGNILKLFNLRKIQSITFHAGLTGEELIGFLTGILQKKREELPAYPHVALDQTVYVAMVKGEEAVVKITEMVNNSGGEIVGLIKSLRESYDLIDRIPDASGRAAAQNQLAQALAKQDPSVLREIFERELPPRMEESGLKTQLLSALSQDQIRDIFGEISVWYDEIRKKESSDFAAVDQLEKLKKFLQAVLHAPAAREIPRQFFEELLQKGLLGQLPEWFSPAPAKPASIFEIEHLLEKDPVELLEKEITDNLPPMVEKLCQIEDSDLLVQFIGKLLENLKNSAAKIRLLAAHASRGVHDILQAHHKEPLLRSMELPLLEAARRETSAETHFILMEMLRQRVRHDLLHGEYDLALRIVDVFDYHSSPETMADEKIRTSAQQAKDALVPEIVEILTTDLKSDNEKKRLGSLQLFDRIKDKAVDPLVRVIKESADTRSRRLAASTLKNLGAKAQQRLKEELNLGLTAEEIIRVVEVLSEAGLRDTLEELNGLLRYPDALVKKEIMRYLARLNTSQSKALIIEQLKDPDSAIVDTAIRLLGELKCAEGVPTLVALLKKNATSPAIQEQVCISLGAIGREEAVPALIDKLVRRACWLTQRRSEAERVRMRAAWALRRFSGSEIERALLAASRDKATPVALTAKESLAIVQQARDGKK